MSCPALLDYTVLPCPVILCIVRYSNLLYSFLFYSALLFLPPHAALDPALRLKQTLTPSPSFVRPPPPTRPLYPSVRPCASLRKQVVPFHSELPKEEMMSAFLPAGKGVVKVVVATNSAESSITLPDVDNVICLGSCKQVYRYSCGGLSLPPSLPPDGTFSRRLCVFHVGVFYCVFCVLVCVAVCDLKVPLSWLMVHSDRTFFFLAWALRYVMCRVSCLFCFFRAKSFKLS